MATIKGKWKFIGGFSWDNAYSNGYQVNFTFTENGIAVSGTQIIVDTGTEIGLRGSDDGIRWLMSGPDLVVHLQESSIVDFGEAEQQIADGLFYIMNLLAIPVNDDGTITLNGRYRVIPAAISKIWATSETNGKYAGPPAWFNINYTNVNGTAFSSLAYFRAGGLSSGTLYFGNNSSDYSHNCGINGFSSAAYGCEIIDFGQQNQTIDARFYGEVLRYALYEEGFVDGAGLATLVSKLTTQNTNQITAAAKNAKATMTTLKAYRSSSTDTSYSNSSLKNYDMLFLIATPSSSSTQVFLTIPMQSISSGAVTEFYVSAGDNTNTTYFTVTATGISVFAGYNQNAASASAGYIKGLYGLKIGG